MSAERSSSAARMGHAAAANAISPALNPSRRASGNPRIREATSIGAIHRVVTGVWGIGPTIGCGAVPRAGMIRDTYGAVGIEVPDAPGGVTGYLFVAFPCRRGVGVGSAADTRVRIGVAAWRTRRVPARAARAPANSARARPTGAQAEDAARQDQLSDSMAPAHYPRLSDHGSSRIAASIIDNMRHNDDSGSRRRRVH